MDNGKANYHSYEGWYDESDSLRELLLKKQKDDLDKEYF